MKLKKGDALDLKELNITPLIKASKTLRKALNETKTPLVRDAVIQRFEYTFELSWKSLRRYFKLNNQLDEYNVRNLIREAGRQNLIDSVEQWFEFHKARNLTSHTYNEEIAEQVYQKAVEFSKEVEKLVERLDNLLV